MDKLLGTVIKAAIATILVSSAVQAATPHVARWQRKRRLRQEKRDIEHKLRVVTDEDRLDRLERMYEAMNRERAKVGLDPIKN